MATSKQIGVGLFVILGLVLFGLGLFLIGSRRQLFQQSFTVYSEFSNLAGLQNGAKVQVAGLDAGEVQGILIPEGPEAQFRVKIRLVEEVHPLVRQNSVATIQTEGLLGNKILIIGAGTNASPPVSPGGTIPGKEPFELADLMDRATEAFDLLQTSVTDIKGDLEEAIALTTETVRHADTLFENTGQDLEAMAASGRTISADLQDITSQLRSGEGTIGKLLYDDELYGVSTEIAQEVRTTMEEARDTVVSVRAVSEQAGEALARLTEAGVGDGVVTDFRVTLDAAREAMSALAENMESLKRNWFFRGLFKERGFYNLDRISVPEYRQGVLRDRHPVMVRKWLEADQLFAEAEEPGEVELTPEGRILLDKAVGDLLRYPENQPLVIEGYAQLEAREEAYVLSQRRAAAVREYVMSQFPIDPTYVTIMPMGDEPPEEFAQGIPEDPSGVAMTLFLTRELAEMVIPNAVS